MYMILRYRSKKKTWRVCGVPNEQRMGLEPAQKLLETLRTAYPNETYQLVFDSTWN